MYDLESLFSEFLFYEQCRGLTGKTVLKLKKHTLILSRFLSESGVRELPQVTTAHIRKFLLDLYESGKAESYVNSHLKSIRAFFVFCENEGYIQTQQNPCLRVHWFKEQSKVVEVFTDSEVSRMIKFADTASTKSKPSVFEQFISQRDKLVIMILADVGIRCHELCSIKMVDFSSDRMFIRQGKGKKDRVVFTSKTVAKQYFKYLRTRNYYCDVFNHPNSEYLLINRYGKKLSVDAVENLIKKVGKKAEVRPHIRCCPHDFRHYAAQKILTNSDNIYAVSKLLGHSRVNTTETYLRSIVSDVFMDEMRDSSPLDSL